MMVVFGQGLLSVSFALQPSPNDCFVVKKKREKKSVRRGGVVGVGVVERGVI